MAASMKPLLLALSEKANLVTLLTGLGHEKLNIFHRWVGWSVFGLSIAHTIPFIIAPLHDGGHSALHKQFYKPRGFEVKDDPEYLKSGCSYWIVYRCTSTGDSLWNGRSIHTLHPSPIYETFYFSRFFLAVTSLGLCFWHFGQEGDSWAYHWATLALWLLSILGRVLYHNQSFRLDNQWLTGFSTRLRSLPDDMTRIDILVPSTLSWRPGQHCFLRFPSFSIFDNHPFTIASVPQSPSRRQSKNSTELQTMSFFVHSHAGFTRKLSRYRSSNFDGSVSPWIDGPYDGVGRRIENEYDTMMPIAGGSGITSYLPWLQYISQSVKYRSGRIANVKFLWGMRDVASLGWISREVEDMSQVAHHGRVVMIFFVTGSIRPEQKLPLRICKIEAGRGDSTCDDQTRGSRTISAAGQWHFGRPDLMQWVPKSLMPGRKVMIGKSVKFRHCQQASR